MDAIECRLCGGSASYVFSAEVLQKYDVGFFKCDQCHSLETEEPYWLDESYSDQRRVLDTSAVRRAQDLQRVVFFASKVFGLRSTDRVLDCGAGDGLFVRMLRDIGLDAYHWDPYASNVYAPGFEGTPGGRYTLATAFEVWEHLAFPNRELGEILQAEPEFHIASTTLYEDQGENWDYLNLLTGRHVFFYSQKGVKYIANQFEYDYFIVGKKIIVLHKRNLSASSLGVLRFILNRRGGRLARCLYESFRKPSLATDDAIRNRESVMKGLLWPLK